MVLPRREGCGCAEVELPRRGGVGVWNGLDQTVKGRTDGVEPLRWCADTQRQGLDTVLRRTAHLSLHKALSCGGAHTRGASPPRIGHNGRPLW